MQIVIGEIEEINEKMKKEEVRKEIGWVGVIVMQKIVGEVVYEIEGVKSIRSQKMRYKRENIRNIEI